MIGAGPGRAGKGEGRESLEIKPSEGRAGQGRGMPGWGMGVGGEEGRRGREGRGSVGLPVYVCFGGGEEVKLGLGAG